MRLTSGLVLLSLLAIGFATTANAEYTETMDPNGPTKNVGSDYGLVDDNAQANQSDVLQKAIGMKAQVKVHDFLGIAEEYRDDLNLRWENKFFEGPSIGAVIDDSGDHYDMIVDNVTMEGFKYNADKPILTEEDFPKGKWAPAVSQWKADHGISGETDKQKNKNDENVKEKKGKKEKVKAGAE